MRMNRYYVVGLLVVLIIFAWILVANNNGSFKPATLQVVNTQQGEFSSHKFNTKNFYVYNNLNSGGVIGYSVNDQNIIKINSDLVEKIINITKTPSDIQVNNTNNQAVISFENSTTHLLVSLNDGKTTRVPQDNLALTWNGENLVRLVKSEDKIYIFEDNTNFGAIDTLINYTTNGSYKIIASENYYVVQYGADDQDYPSNQVITIDRNNNNAVTITNLNNAFSIDWTPDNKYIVDNVITDNSETKSVLYLNPATNTTKIFTGPNLANKPIAKLANGSYLHVNQVSSQIGYYWQISVVNPNQAELTQSFTIEIPTTDYCYYFYYHNETIYGINNGEIISVPLKYITEHAST